jgi:hypothetical protein
MTPFFIFRESDIQYVEANNVFHTPGIYYRPDNLKSMTALMGNTEARVIYKNFQLLNLNSNALDYSHYMYQKYLQYNYFVPPGNTKYFIHLQNNVVPNEPATTDSKGLFNLFPLDLNGSGEGLEVGKKEHNELKTPAKTLGIVSTSPLKLEIEFSPVPTMQWFLVYTFIYLNKINFSGSKDKQDVTYDHV